ncbi:MAG TPA: diguanylate cyclase [Acidimicrobiales bacterium]|nr:diguanylate cyclase [Acidimicrobiales bacterium]
MGFSTTDRLQAIGYQRARLLLVFAGLGILSVVTIIMYVRRVDTVEVVATLLFVPIFLGFLFFRVPGGLVAALGASALYVVLRLPAIDAIGFAAFAGLIMSRTFAYLVFGLLGGWSNQVLEDSLDKLELYDQIDDATGLFNARSFVQDTELEVARSARYETLFSISVIELPVGPIAALGRRRHDAILRGLGRRLAESVRSVDRVAHARDDSSRIFAAILPETSSQGGATLSQRFADAIHGFLTSQGVEIERSKVTHRTITVPGDEDALSTLCRQFTEIDAQEHAPVGRTTAQR